MLHSATPPPLALGQGPNTLGETIFIPEGILATVANQEMFFQRWHQGFSQPTQCVEFNSLFGGMILVNGHPTVIPAGPAYPDWDAIIMQPVYAPDAAASVNCDSTDATTAFNSLSTSGNRPST